MNTEPSILIVDDDTRMRLSLSLILQKEKFHVESAMNAEEALAKLGSWAYDLMFLDLNMPGMPGIDLLVEVRKRHPQLPVLIFTAHAALDSAIQAVRLGARDYLLKPIEPVAILTRVAEVLSEKELPARKKEIVGQMQSLLAELKEIEGTETDPIGAPESLEPADPARILKKGGFELDLHTRQVMLDGRYVPVTGVYFDFLVTLIRHAPKAVSYKTLVKESQGYDATATEAQDLARWRIHELRKALEADPGEPLHILTVRGIGYRLAI